MIDWHPAPKHLKEFLEDHSSQRIIVVIKAEDYHNFFEDRGFFELLLTKQKNFALKFEDMENITEEKLVEIKRNDIPFFFNEYVDRFEMLYNFFDLGVSDVYITNELGFDIKRAAALCHEHNVNVRCFPNIAQSCWDNEPVLTRFFIRPDDIEKYNDYIDVCEFYNLSFYDNKRTTAEVLYKVYTEDKHWNGELGEIIQGLPAIEVDNRFLHPAWVNKRIDCQKKCLKGGSCNMCNELKTLADILSKTGIIVKPK